MKKTIAIGLACTGLGLAGGYAYAEHQPHMHQAMKHLEQAKGSLEKAEPDKGGHRAKAIELVNSAMKEVKEGIEFADHH